MRNVGDVEITNDVSLALFYTELLDISIFRFY